MARTALAKKTTPDATPDASVDAPVEPASKVLTVFEVLMNCACLTDTKFSQQNAKETDQKFFHRLLGVISEASEEDFELMAEAGQDWYNENAVRVSEKQEVQAPEGFESAFAAASAKAAPAKAAPAKAAPAKAAPAVSAEKADGVVVQMLRLMLTNLGTSTADLHTLGESTIPNFKKSTFSVVLTNLNAYIRIAKETGHWK